MRVESILAQGCRRIDDQIESERDWRNLTGAESSFELKIARISSQEVIQQLIGDPGRASFC